MIDIRTKLAAMTRYKNDKNNDCLRATKYFLHSLATSMLSRMFVMADDSMPSDLQNSFEAEIQVCIWKKDKKDFTTRTNNLNLMYSATQR